MKLTNFVICFLILLNFSILLECASSKGKEKVGSSSGRRQEHDFDLNLSYGQEHNAQSYGEQGYGGLGHDAQGYGGQRHDAQEYGEQGYGEQDMADKDMVDKDTMNKDPMSKIYVTGYTVTMKEDPEYHPIQDFHIKGTEEFEDSMNTACEASNVVEGDDEAQDVEAAESD
uniref:Uncharacterized protein n=1 Tax=Meloidogyne javanica TaxID=6303 RepID=A0A915LEH7_MELJA